MTKRDEIRTAVAREWAAKILASRTTVHWQADYFSEDIDAAADHQLRLVRGLLPDALRTWAHRAAMDWSAITEQDVQTLAAEMANTIYQAADAQRRIDAQTVDLVTAETWPVPPPQVKARRTLPEM
jgi:hypothetical protein